jgi:predicted Mrr-cat superfamily restriction endonuclease
MNIEHKTIWQCACGNVVEGHYEGTRDFSDVCFADGVIMIGPGCAGSCSRSQEKLKTSYWFYELSPEKQERERRVIRHFVEDVSIGDIVILHRGTKTVLGVGIAGEYRWDSKYGDGTYPSLKKWGQEHCRQVRWLWTGHKDDFPPHTLAIARFVRLGPFSIVRDWLKTLQRNLPD